MLSEQIVAASMRFLEEQEVMETMSAFFGGLVGGARGSNYEECFNCFHGSNRAKSGRRDMGVYGMALRQGQRRSHDLECTSFSIATEVVMNRYLTGFGRGKERRTAMLHNNVHFRIPKEEVWNERREDWW